VDGDGGTDLLMQFALVDTGLHPSDSQACLTGDTLGGTAFQGCEAVVVVGP
jgi:hypothetical protein